ncbi:6-pyruvoyl trahydropterin synthase family protein [Marinimicrococcus flavescens]|uniref:6-carboxy-5,6,7,8-tetrahydropterin synthase n=1 Tax=Marinimicrococcus flavescens TaxID=3031815 RepID=A0AAP4D6F5_9PROT|nr:6-carboxytetrahydropterin synthase [Marinimicrococcus flavescens]
MFTVRVRDHVMIAHSFKGELFGPAQKLHGATFVVDVEFRREELGPEGVVVDIGRATVALGELLARINYRNLDELPEFAGKNTTTEFLAHWIFGEMRKVIAAGGLGPGGADLVSMKVEIAESHVAWAGYEGALR